MSAHRLIEAELTFLPKSQGGRDYPDGMLKGRRYRPGIVIGDPHQREATTDSAGRVSEVQLGVAFCSGPHRIYAGKPLTAVFSALAWPDPICDALATGATFTVREGSRIIGFGRVNKAWTESVT